MMNLSRCTAGVADTPLSLVKFLLPLRHDALALPAALTLIDTVCHRASLAHEIVAVDDASSDGTAAEARRFAHFMPLWLIQHGRPVGRSTALRTAVEAACRDTSEDDLLVPIDARRRPDAASLLRAIQAARVGWQAVLVPARPLFAEDQAEPCPDEVAVYRAGLIQRHLPRFLENAPSTEEEAVRQLERYLLSAGVAFHRLSAPPAPSIGARPVRGRMEPAIRIGSESGEARLVPRLRG